MHTCHLPCAPLGPDDLELLATSAYMVGREHELLRLLERAHQAWADAGDVRAAARTAIWLCLHLQIRATYGANFERVAAVKQQYDPDNVFRMNRNISRAAAGERS